ncbi:transcriptional regulator [Variovorax sp. Root318D1]|uniref:MucB/RseB C-terminal domain-containing protein n=1 Tax=Variovorax sp. Root318D1 TaxID=1736513 RepID=UPI0006FAB10D|nr:MucB/RseB C-terminal domain-containing protein [Variovorax sp. Root318D1]KQU84808.1 transcriptional regulator [Variovorax sp. Root318D1]
MTVQMPISARAFALVLAAFCLVQIAAAQSRPGPANARSAASVQAGDAPPAMGVVEWLQRMHAGARQRNYVGTFVVSAAGGDLSSARIWHVRDGDMQIERIEALSGPPRSTFRRNHHVMTFLPEAKVVKVEKRENLDLFPNLPDKPDSSIGDFYDVRAIGKDRVAGFDADVVQLLPHDGLRFGYRIWSERRSGLVMKLQTIDSDSRVVEQSAFSELQLDAPVKAQALAQMMANTGGYRIEKLELERTSAQDEGWTLKSPVAGFKPRSFYRRGDKTGQDRTVQWTFSDGLASVSLFIERYDEKRAPRDGVLTIGATNAIRRRLPEPASDWWLTAVGEVPQQTLNAFAQSLARTR